MGIAFVFSNLQLSNDSLLWTSIQNSGHGVLMCLAVLFGIKTLSINTKSKYFVIALVSLGLFVVGIIIETIQYIAGRGADLNDVFMNSAGILAGIFLGCVESARGKWVHNTIYIVFAVVVIAWCVRTPIYYFSANLFTPKLPVLANFDGFLSAAKIQENGAELELKHHQKDWPENETKQLKVTFNPGQWPSVHFLEPLSDWSNYSEFDFTVLNAHSESVNLYIRVDDASIQVPGRSYMTVKRLVPTGISSVRIRFNEFSESAYSGVDPTFLEITGFTFFIFNLSTTRVLYFDDVRLK